MPVDFLTDAQEKRYGRYGDLPSPAQLARYFHLSDADREIIARRRGEHNRLGFALQLCTVRFLGTFPEDLTEVPDLVIKALASQLGIKDYTDFDWMQRYCTGETRWDHSMEIRQHYGYRDFSSQPEHFRLVRWLYTRAWLTAERPSVLFDLATARLVENKVLLPGVSVLARLVAGVRDRAALRLWRMLAVIPNTEQRTRLQQLLIASDGTRQTPLDRLRRAPTRLSAPSLVSALKRVEEIRELGVNLLNVSNIPPSRLKALARYAMAARAQAIERMPEERRLATLLAFAIVVEAIAQDDAIDLLDQMIGKVLARAERIGQQERLRTLKDLDSAALSLSEACQMLLDPSYEDLQVRNCIFERIAPERLQEAIATVSDLARPPDDNYYDQLPTRYSLVRQFLPGLLRTISFAGTDAAQPVLEALQFLRSIEGRKKPPMNEAPLKIVTKPWRRFVIGQGKQIDRCYYTFCTLERLKDCLSRRDIFVNKSERWNDPRSKLLQGSDWEAVRTQVCRTLGRSLSFESELAKLKTQLSEAYQRTSANLPTNSAIRIERIDGKDNIVLTGLDKLDEPPSLITLRQRVDALLPQIDLPEAILEIQALTRFADEFTHISEGSARVDDLALSICAVLTAEASNTGLETVVRKDLAALTRGRLSWIQQNYIRLEPLIRANARLVDEQSRIPLAQFWGGGEVASADGLRFVVPVRTINAGPNTKYFGVGRGVTYYNFTSDQFTGFHSIVIPGTLRDSLFILDGLLEHQTTLNPTEVMSDTAGYSDVVFGLFWLLGFQFSPRLADIGRTRFWRINQDDCYGVLDSIAHHQINATLIAQNWDDLLRVAGSLKLGTVSASDLMRTLQAGDKPSTLTRAIAELGRIAKTLYLLAYIDDETYRRRILTQLNRGEGRHNLARVTFHGQRGELRQRYREGQEDQLGALGLVVNVLVLWNTRYMDSALNYLRASGTEVKPEDVARLSPLGHAHINLLGKYSFALAESVKRGELRPLRNPNLLDDQYS